MEHRRLIEEVTGHDKAITAVASWAKRFNECNPDNNAVVGFSGLCAYDEEGSGEFCEAECVNINEATTNADEVYRIYVLA